MSRRAKMRRHSRRAMTPADIVLADHLAELVCHDEQMEIWEGEVLEELVEFLHRPADFQDLSRLRYATNRAIRHIVTSAFTHPEIIGLPSEKARK